MKDKGIFPCAENDVLRDGLCPHFGLYRIDGDTHLQAWLQSSEVAINVLYFLECNFVCSKDRQTQETVVLFLYFLSQRGLLKRRRFSVDFLDKRVGRARKEQIYRRNSSSQ